jgi:hypothetical protein
VIAREPVADCDGARAVVVGGRLLRARGARRGDATMTATIKPVAERSAVVRADLKSGRDAAVVFATASGTDRASATSPGSSSNRR